jgi:hypothetical protein
MRGRAELQAGVIMLAGGIMGLTALKLWGTAPIARGTGSIFTSLGFTSFVAAALLVGVVCIGAVLTVLGVILWQIGRARDARMKRTAEGRRG